ncbi:NADH-ubiquinone oxidoreductase subunit 6 (mitochondrion) [Cyanidioschyzon merolae]|uniref:NADH-ubiquinone oxidoreductase chain 6 n=2 Tax=Cyanidioschyzon merolae TaxID=45157 RepID=Q9ZZR1_CYAM1|nr:NADH dehydrogenase subunit 6 [Cyanidioschyzon merolae]BAA34654.1 NADH-ubiquinone oxidoreductase chain 6 [Cyanidioschyzon merolae strain 10D]BBU60034.1 NADH-ubiquinone oxidoreductase subunit 6 [Cyanidioschyzon merolae]
MSSELVLFYCLASIIIVSSYIVISLKNSVFSILFLVLIFLNAAALIMMLETEFLAILFLIVYVGAIAVLFLFVIIILNVKLSEFYYSIGQYILIGSILGIIFLVQTFLILDTNIEFHFLDNIHNLYPEWNFEVYSQSNIEALGSNLYTNYMYVFILAAIILLIAIIGAIVLTIHQRGYVKRQNILNQVSRDFKDSVYYINKIVK